MIVFSHSLQRQLVTLGLAADEAKIYVTLLSKPASHLQLSRLTGVNRSRVYRIIAKLEQRGLIARQTDDTGTFLVATNPESLRIELDQQAQQLKERRMALKKLEQKLHTLEAQQTSGFKVRTYEGTAGMKQMLWNELHARKQLLALGNGTVEELAQDSLWSQQHRIKQTESGYRSYSVLNVRRLDAAPLIVDAGLYTARYLSETIAKFDDQIVIYNDTVAIYSWDTAYQTGVEIVSASYASLMRHLFRQYWRQAGAVSANAPRR